ncbi:MAG: PAS domain-containing protein, partial [Bacteroidales bacterium]|nr:PAS domain-containing protein [Bacteroidales bacterium]
FFSHSPNRVFERNRSIIGRDVRLCHPPGSVNIVEQILEDFKSGKENKAKFWISNFMGRFVYIEYTALRGKDNEYLGVIEVTQDISEFRKLQGDQRLLSYSK